MSLLTMATKLVIWVPLNGAKMVKCLFHVTYLWEVGSWYLVIIRICQILIFGILTKVIRFLFTLRILSWSLMWTCWCIPKHFNCIHKGPILAFLWKIILLVFLILKVLAIWAYWANPTSNIRALLGPWINPILLYFANASIMIIMMHLLGSFGHIMNSQGWISGATSSTYTEVVYFDLASNWLAIWSIKKLVLLHHCIAPVLWLLTLALNQLWNIHAHIRHFSLAYVVCIRLWTYCFWLVDALYEILLFYGIGRQNVFRGTCLWYSFSLAFRLYLILEHTVVLGVLRWALSGAHQLLLIDHLIFSIWPLIWLLDIILIWIWHLWLLNWLIMVSPESLIIFRWRCIWSIWPLRAITLQIIALWRFLKLPLTQAL